MNDGAELVVARRLFSNADIIPSFYATHLNGRSAWQGGSELISSHAQILSGQNIGVHPIAGDHKLHIMIDSAPPNHAARPVRFIIIVVVTANCEISATSLIDPNEAAAKAPGTSLHARCGASLGRQGYAAIRIN